MDATTALCTLQSKSYNNSSIIVPGYYIYDSKIYESFCIFVPFLLMILFSLLTPQRGATIGFAYLCCSVLRQDLWDTLVFLPNTHRENPLHFHFTLPLPSYEIQFVSQLNRKKSKMQSKSTKFSWCALKETWPLVGIFEGR